MARFKIEWTEEIWNRVFVEADSRNEALEMFWLGEFDWQSVKNIGVEVQDGVDVEEVE